MHTSRLATFLLGVWVACSILVDAIAWENVRFIDQLLGAPRNSAAELIKNLGPQKAELLLRHFANEQNRYYFSNWELIQFAIFGALLITLFFISGKRSLPILLSSLMLAIVLFEFFFVTPELTYVGRAADFQPAASSFDTQARIWALTEVFIVAEAVKLAIGGVFASYMFSIKTRPRRKSDAVKEIARAARAAS